MVQHIRGKCGKLGPFDLSITKGATRCVALFGFAEMLRGRPLPPICVRDKSRPKITLTFG